MFAIDPSVTVEFDTAVINQATLRIPWEEPLEPGPKGEYLEVVDEPNAPVDLNDAEILAGDGLTPSDGDPQFHQQMVYAVAMNTIRHFERALGRQAHWTEEGGTYRRRLKLFPHGIENTANAYLAPDGIRFGSFVTDETAAMPRTAIFTALSQDVIAHEVTHALVSGMSTGLEDESNPDAAALHEGFANIVALLQHFTKSDVLRWQMAKVRGRLEEASLLGVVARQLAQGLGKEGGIASAFGSFENGEWRRRDPDPKLLEERTEPHERGDVLMAAVFLAFRKIYEARTVDLTRMAARSSESASGDLHPDLVERLTDEASKSAEHVLRICIRALDYLPPVGATFGAFLRALLTADYDFDPVDERSYRIAFLDAFRSYGIRPEDVQTLCIDTLVWPPSDESDATAAIAAFAKELADEHTYWQLPSDREELWNLLGGWKERLAEALRGVGGDGGKRLGCIDVGRPFEILTFQLREQAGVGGDLALQWVAKIVQPPFGGNAKRRVGSTLLVDAETGAVRYRIEGGRKPKPAPEPPPLELRTPAPVPGRARRRLRVFAFDPTAGVEVATAGINQVTLDIPWEPGGPDGLSAGPVGEYVEVVDRDPPSRKFYAPVDLNDPRIVAQDGLPPSESDPQFHQQMVYAVAMRTIRHFERSLGRLALWSPHRFEGVDGGLDEEYVRRLRIYPHALREPNAYYRSDKKALLFGYFRAPTGTEDEAGEAINVFTCLAYDVVAHETTHALLDGIHRRFSEPSNRDVLAFHEAFADLVALLQRFALPDVLRHQIAATRGDLAEQNRLGELALQFGRATGRRGALRSAIGEIDPETKEWRRRPPDPEAYRHEREPHKRGALLVAAVFDAFLTLYKSRVADLFRIATGGTGVLPAGQLHPDLVNRLADEASGSALEILTMCIRALDYCPPVDLTFGDYLRAVVTADYAFDPVDRSNRRIAFVEAFRRHGIVPADVRTLSVDGLLWTPTAARGGAMQNFKIEPVAQWMRDIPSWNLSRDRRKLYELTRDRRRALHGYLKQRLADPAVLSGIDRSLKFEVHSVRPSTWMGLDDRLRFQWIIELTQRVKVEAEDDRPGFYFRGGSTLVVDARDGSVRYSIDKPLDDARKERQRKFVVDADQSLAATYFGGVGTPEGERFALLHRFAGSDGVEP